MFTMMFAQVFVVKQNVKSAKHPIHSRGAHANTSFCERRHFVRLHTELHFVVHVWTVYNTKCSKLMLYFVFSSTSSMTKRIQVFWFWSQTVQSDSARSGPRSEKDAPLHPAHFAASSLHACDTSVDATRRFTEVTAIRASALSPTRAMTDSSPLRFSGSLTNRSSDLRARQEFLCERRNI